MPWENRKDVVDGLGGSISFIQLADPTGSKNNRKITWLICNFMNVGLVVLVSV